MNSTSTCIDSLLISITRYYLTRIAEVTGIIFNAICIIVLSIMVKNRVNNYRGYMFHYLLFKSITDTTYFLIHINEIIIYCPNCNLKNVLYFKLFHVYFYRYVKYSINMCSIYFEVMATFDCYLVITKRFKFCLTKTFFILMTIGVFFFCFLFYSYNLGVYVVKINGNFTNKNSSSQRYDLKYSKIFTIYHKYLDYINICFKDIVPICLLISINVSLKLKLNQIVEKKHKLLANATKSLKNKKNSNQLLRRAVEAERKKLQFIILIGVNFLIGHTPMAIYDSPLRNLSLSILWQCYAAVCWLIFLTSNSLSVVIYICFNKKFKQVLFELFQCFK
jgi:hypothetical protein